MSGGSTKEGAANGRDVTPDFEKLTPGVEPGSRVVDHEVGESGLLGRRHLGENSTHRLYLGDPISLHQPPLLDRRADRHEDRRIDLPVKTGFK